VHPVAVILGPLSDSVKPDFLERVSELRAWSCALAFERGSMVVLGVEERQVTAAWPCPNTSLTRPGDVVAEWYTRPDVALDAAPRGCAESYTRPPRRVPAACVPPDAVPRRYGLHRFGTVAPDAV
jgi:hypothetical protein